MGQTGVASGLSVRASILTDVGRRRQVNEDWMARYRGWAYGAGFGLQLGLGVVTIVTTASERSVDATVFLSKPIDRDALLRALEQHARRT